MNFSGRIMLMKDERITKELNKIKGYVLVYVFAAALLFGFIKYLIYGYVYQMYLVEMVVVTISMITLLSTLFVKNNKAFDERLEMNVGRIYQVGYSLLVVGGLWTHFYSVVTTPFNILSMGFITNTLILIGLIVLLILLKRKKIYANYKMIESSKKSYYKFVLTNVLKFFFLFIFITGSIMGIDYLFDVMVSEIEILIYLALISFIMLSTEYFIFSIYEKNNFDESLLFEANKPFYLTKNAFLFSLILSIWGFVIGYVNLRSTIESLANHHSPAFNQWALYSKFLNLLSIDFIILGIIVMVIIYLYIKTIIKNNFVIKIILIDIIISTIFGVFNYLASVFLPIILGRINNGVEIQRILRIYSNINSSYLLLHLVFICIYVFYLYKHKIIYYKLAILYLFLAILFERFFLIRVFMFDFTVIATFQFVTHTFLQLILLIIYYLYSHKQLDLNIEIDLKLEEESTL